MKLSHLLPIVSLLLLGCVQPFQSSVYTSNGQPELLINASVSQIEAVIVQDAFSLPYVVEAKNAYTLRMSRWLDGNDGARASLDMSGRYVVTYNFSEEDGKTRVNVSVQLVYMVDQGRGIELANRDELIFKQYQEQLERWKRLVESK